MKFQSTSFLLLVSLFSFTYFSSCKTNIEAKEMPESVTNYVYAFTSGSISKAKAIQVQLTSPVGQSMVGESLEKGIVSFSPSIKGIATWKDAQTIVFQPKESLPSSTHYLGKVSLGKLFKNVPKEAKTFEFNFSTKEQHYSVSVENLQNDPSGDEKKKQLSGWLHTADVAESIEIEKMVTASQNGNKLPIKWEHKDGNIKHNFVIENIQRGESVSEVEVNWNGKSINVDKESGKKIEIPALGEFKVMDAKVIQGDNPHIVLYFSDPLNKSQDLKGLISIEGLKGNLKYLINGSSVQVFPNKKGAGTMTVKAAVGIKSAQGYKMKKASEWKLILKQKKPRVRLAGTGVIMPNSNGLMFPFDAVNLNYVDVEVLKIFNNNVLQFLQNNEVDGQYDLNRVGRIILQKQIKLSELNPDAEAKGWNRYALDLSDLINDDPHAIYQVNLGFRPEYATYTCSTDDEAAGDNLKKVEDPFVKNDGKKFKSIWRVYRRNYDGYKYEHRSDPCYPAYYSNNRFVRRNVLASDMGILAKRGTDGNFMFAITDLRTTDPMGNVELEFYDYQQQLMKSTTTDGKGMGAINLDENPFVVIAKKGSQRGYLKLMDQNSLPLGRFDVGGSYAQKGLKGFMYGERGVWRPGDSIYLNFILEDKMKKLPTNHPVTFELFDARGQLKEKRTVLENVNNVYALHTSTSSDAPTGNWRAVAKVGGAKFTKNLKVETVKPNRLKINMDFGKEKFAPTDENLTGDLEVKWLHGAPGSNLKAKVEMQLNSARTYFKEFKKYSFNDPTRKFSQSPQTIFEGKLDGDGKAKVKSELNIRNRAKGKIRAAFKVRAFEKGGDFSNDQFSVNYDPFESYAGVQIPLNKYHEQRIEVERDGTLDFVAVDGDGKALNGRKLNIGLYRVKWRWWWDSYSNDLMQYNTSTHKLAIKKKSVVTNGKGKADWTINVEEWGRYMVRVCDEESGHCSGSFFYAGYPWYEMDEDDDDESDNTYANQQMRQAAAMLAFVSDKEKYNVGEQVKLNIPASEAGRCLISIENGSRVVETYWIDAKKGDNEFSFFAQEEMTPTVYAHVTLIQPHGQVKNDLPIRMYGIIPIHVEDKNTRLDPELNMPKELKPEETFTLKVSEKEGKAMTYTVAVVDDGLLDLTRFKTPQPWKTFYAREALGVKTWDMYDQVLGAYGGKLESILSIGGDDEVGKKKDGAKANRFKPVVVHLGPYYLEKGQTATHKITMPNYVGSVRTMIVASQDGAYGNDEKTTPVRKPLMMLATLPRVLGPGETLKLPVNIFAMDKKVKNVKVKIVEESGLVELLGTNTQSLSFSKIGDKMATFDIRVNESIGVAKFKMTAVGGGENASQEIEIQVRNPNPYVTEVTEKILQPGDTWSPEFAAVGVKGTNSGVLEVSNIPPINLGRRLQYLVRYPHGCVEQTTSGAFPQLYVSKLLDVDERIKKETEKNVRRAIKRLKKFQTTEGGLAYWPGERDHSDWGTSYAGHFLFEAKALGYQLPLNMEDRWVSYQKKMARNWTNYVESNSSWKYYNRTWRLKQKQLDQAYRLYTLAVSGNPELGAMNQLREIKGIYSVASWRLAGAYALAGKPEVAEEIIKDLNVTVEDYRALSYSYGSGTRDEAMILEVLTQMKKMDQAAGLAKRIATRLSDDRWMGTQTVAFSLMAVGKFVGDNAMDKNFKFTYKIGDQKTVNAGSSKPMYQLDVPVDKMPNQTITTKNESSGVLYVRMVSTGQPLIGDQKEEDSNLRMSITYRDMNGKKINPKYLVQGTDFIAEVSITNPGYRYRLDEMALNQVFPSGWEIHNSRMSNMTKFKNSTRPEYQDVRDDRVLTYFDIYRNNNHTYRVQLNAAYQGKYYLPTTYCEAMYDDNIFSRKPGMWVEVGKPGTDINIEAGCK